MRVDEVPAVWARRLWPGRIPPEVDPAFAHHCAKESRTAFFDALALLEGAHWVNAIGPLSAAESKLRQLQVAREVGLVVPQTLVTNDPSAARTFHEETNRSMVTKLLGALSQTMNATGEFMYTSVVRDEDMAAIESLKLCPQIFQPLVEKRCELRVIVVGDRVFAGSIDASTLARGRVDWRLTRPDEGVSCTRAELSSGVEGKVLALLRRLDLRYGAVDFIVTPDGRNVFLEVNAVGEFFWLQRNPGLPMVEAIADVLLGRAPRLLVRLEAWANHTGADHRGGALAQSFGD